MKKALKSVLCLFLFIALIFSSTINAFAAESNQSNSEITVEDIFSYYPHYLSDNLLFNNTDIINLITNSYATVLQNTDSDLASYVYSLKNLFSIVVSDYLKVGETVKEQILKETAKLLLSEYGAAIDSESKAIKKISKKFNLVKKTYKIKTESEKQSFINDLSSACSSFTKEEINDAVNIFFENETKINEAFSAVGKAIDFTQLIISYIELLEADIEIINDIISMLPERSDLRQACVLYLKDRLKSPAQYAIDYYTPKLVKKALSGIIGVLGPVSLATMIIDISTELLYWGPSADDIARSTYLSAYASELYMLMCQKQFTFEKGEISNYEEGIDDYRFIHELWISAERATIESTKKITKDEQYLSKLNVASAAVDTYSFDSYIRIVQNTIQDVLSNPNEEIIHNCRFDRIEYQKEHPHNGIAYCTVVVDAQGNCCGKTKEIENANYKNSGCALCSQSSDIVARLKAKYPDGKYWNHALGAANNPDGWTDTPCDHSKTKDTCNQYVENGYPRAKQCYGYVYQLAYCAYGGTPYADWILDRSSAKADNIKAGDIVEYDISGTAHLIWVYKIDGNILTFSDCNRYNGACQIRWDQTADKTKLSINAVHKAPYVLPTQSSGENASAADAIIKRRIDEIYDFLGGKCFTTTLSTCGNSNCDQCKLSAIIKSDWFAKQYGSVTMEQMPYNECWSCVAFAAFSTWYIFKEDNTYNVRLDTIGSFTNDYSTLSKNVMVGDHIYYQESQHTAIVVSVDSDGVLVLDSNWTDGGTYPRNTVRMRKMGFNSNEKVTIERAKNRSEIGNTEPIDQPTDPKAEIIIDAPDKYTSAGIIEVGFKVQNIKLTDGVATVMFNIHYDPAVLELINQNSSDNSIRFTKVQTPSNWESMSKAQPESGLIAVQFTTTANSPYLVKKTGDFYISVQFKAKTNAKADTKISVKNVAVGDKTLSRFEGKGNEKTLKYLKRMLGDVNGDNIIDAFDYAMTKSHVLGTYTLAGDDLDASDVNKDGRIDAFDYAMIKSHVLRTYTIQQ